MQRYFTVLHVALHVFRAWLPVFSALLLFINIKYQHAEISALVNYHSLAYVFLELGYWSAAFFVHARKCCRAHLHHVISDVLVLHQSMPKKVKLEAQVSTCNMKNLQNVSQIEIMGK